MRTILFLSDSVNRRMISLYEKSGLELPNLTRLAERSCVFENHWVGSSPCMPARRDIMTGRLNFLERGWGPMEPIDEPLPTILRENGVSTHMITDHYHYFELGGEDYVPLFDQWDFIRGQEWDPSNFPSGDCTPDHIGKFHPQYARNRERFRQDESLYPSAVTIDKSAEWLETNHALDNFFLWIEPFDPHEPFEVPQKYLDMLGDDYDGPLYLWPEYGKVDVTDAQLRHVRRRYAALLLMTDHHLGKVLDVMDRHDMWRDTCFVYTTDHGYMLGEHDFMAKNYMPAYNECFHIPLLIHFPQDRYAGERVRFLTQNIDLVPTILEVQSIRRSEEAPPLHGISILSVLEGRTEPHTYVLYGNFGKAVNITDGRYTYFRAPRNGNRPLNMYTSVPYDNKVFFDRRRVKDLSTIECGRFLAWSPIPVYRIPASEIRNKPGYALDYNHLQPWETEDMLFDLTTDYAQNENLAGQRPEAEERLAAAMADLIRQYQAPEDQLLRMGLADQ